MRLSRSGTKAIFFSATLLLSCPFLIEHAHAAHPGSNPDAFASSAIGYNNAPESAISSTDFRSSRLARRVASRSGISCVPYAREVSGIKVVGNAWQWWNRAKGIYARGDQPEAGSVLNFRSNGRMQLGHVAVVTRVINARQVIVDHANWANGGRISRNVAVVDVSEANNWSAVRVELGRPGDFGSIYPTFGFIYNRPDTGFVLASVARPAPQPAINPVPSDLRPPAERPWRTTIEEVAEAPTSSSQRADTATTPSAGCAKAWPNCKAGGERFVPVVAA